MDNTQLVSNLQAQEPKFTSKHFHLPRVILIIFIAFLSGGVFGTLGYYIGIGQQANSTPQVDNTNHIKYTISPSPTKMKVLFDAGVTPGIKEYPPINIPTPNISQNQINTNLIKIQELGIELKVPNSIKDIVYTVDNSDSGTYSTGQQVTTILLSTTTLSGLYPACAVSSSAPAFGSLSRVTGQYPKNPDDAGNTAGVLVKQFASFYIGYIPPTIICSYNSNGSVSDTGERDLNEFLQALYTIQPLQ